jgi:hypothetical protein
LIQHELAEKIFFFCWNFLSVCFVDIDNDFLIFLLGSDAPLAPDFKEFFLENKWKKEN